MIKQTNSKNIQHFTCIFHIKSIFYKFIKLPYMKKIVYLAVSINLFAFACQPKETKTEQAALPHQFGIVVDTSANISLVLKTFEAVNNLDTMALWANA